MKTMIFYNKSPFKKISHTQLELQRNFLENSRGAF